MSSRLPNVCIFTLSGFGEFQIVADRNIQAENSFQVYQGSLPPLAVPQSLSALPEPGGKVALQWSEVRGAAEYQLYRVGPSSSLTLNSVSFVQPLGEVTSAREYIDQTPEDGTYAYGVASIRRVGDKTASSAPGSAVLVTADSTPPASPRDLELALYGRGIAARWKAPELVTETLLYRLYRRNLPPGETMVIQGMEPIIDRITSLQALDSSPSALEHSYAVTALDAAGNESMVSATSYLNFSLLPVKSISLKKVENEAPVISWKGQAGNSFRAQALGENGTFTLYDGELSQFADTTYVSGERLYSILTRDPHGVESPTRGLLLPDLKVTPHGDLVIKQGVFGKMLFAVENVGVSQLEGLRLQLMEGSDKSQSEVFSLPGLGMQIVDVPQGSLGSTGTTEEGEEVSFTQRVLYAPAIGEEVQIDRDLSAAVEHQVLVFSLESEGLKRGVVGKVRINCENTSEVETEILTATAKGTKPSPELRLKLVDDAGNVLAVVPVLQNKGTGVFTLATGQTVARVPASTSQQIAEVSIPVPASAPRAARLVLEVDKLYYRLGTQQQLSIAGYGTTQTVNLDETPYVGQVTEVTPEVSTGEETIIIRGSSLSRETLQGVGLQQLDLIVRMAGAKAGLERRIVVQTDEQGNFSQVWKPQEGESGMFYVCAVYPRSLERPRQGSFLLQSVKVSPAENRIKVARNYQANIKLELQAGLGTSYSNVRLVYEPGAQPTGSLVSGVAIRLPEPIQLNAGALAKVEVGFSADRNAEEKGVVVLGVKSDNSADNTLSRVIFNYTLAAAAPSLVFNPANLETGLKKGEHSQETLVIENQGLAPLVGGTLSLVALPGGSLVPEWVTLDGNSSIERLDVGQSQNVSLVFRPDLAVADGYYEFGLRVETPSEKSVLAPIVVSISESGEGQALLRIIDLYTGTLDAQGKLIAGLKGAQVSLAHEELTEISRKGNTDSRGELLFTGLVPGVYQVRASASGHETVTSRIKVRPGLTSSEQILLVNELVSVQWSVEETSIVDKYEIVLTANYETQIPAPVLVFEPLSVRIPDLKKGEVYNGELILTNRGQIPVTGLKTTKPQAKGLQWSFFPEESPERINPMEKVRISYRVVALSDMDATGSGNSSGAGVKLCPRSALLRLSGSAYCAADQDFKVSAYLPWFYSTEPCSASVIKPPTENTYGNLGGTGTTNTHSAPKSIGFIQCLPGDPCVAEGAGPTATYRR